MTEIATSLVVLGAGILAQGFDRPTDLTSSTRSMVLARRGVVATSQPLAAQAGLAVLRRGGNAFDAAVATAAVLNVVEPMSTGIGGDMFALAWVASEGKLVGLNGSGRSSRHATLERARAGGRERIPTYGAEAVSVPGALDGWLTLHSRWGKLPLADVLADAIHYAENGFPVSEVIASGWAEHVDFKEYPGFAATYLIKTDNGDFRAPRLGEVFRQPDLARTFRRIAEGGRDAFYEGPIAEKMAATLKANGSLIDAQDLAEHTSTWVEPVSTTFKGYDVYELPPNGQGIAVLQLLNVLEGYDLEKLGHNSAEYIHLFAEAKKLVFADRDIFIADPALVELPVETLISKEYAARVRARIDRERASTGHPESVLAESTDTVYVATADSDGNVVSFINSIFHGFGSHVVVEGTGICLQNRGALFSLDPEHRNAIAPRKRPFQTIIPGFVLKEGKPYLAFGVMGGDFQPQGHLQVLLNHILFGMNPQETGEAARVCESDGTILVESGVSSAAREGLRKLGHRVQSAVGAFGGYQAILIDPDGGYRAGSDNRKDGCAVGY